MAEESAYQFAVNLFNEFRDDTFFAPAFKTLSVTTTTTTGSVFGGGTETTETITAECQEMGGNTKRRAIQTIDSIQATDIMIQGLTDEITPPENGKAFTFNGVDLIAVHHYFDPTGATFVLFGRGT